MSYDEATKYEGLYRPQQQLLVMLMQYCRLSSQYQSLHLQENVVHVFGYRTQFFSSAPRRLMNLCLFV